LRRSKLTITTHHLLNGNSHLKLRTVLKHRSTRTSSHQFKLLRLHHQLTLRLKAKLKKTRKRKKKSQRSHSCSRGISALNRKRVCQVCSHWQSSCVSAVSAAFTTSKINSQAPQNSKMRILPATQCKKLKSTLLRQFNKQPGSQSSLLHLSGMPFDSCV
jgi:hypothetical protein